jgi:hypothetical protein
MGCNSSFYINFFFTFISFYLFALITFLPFFIQRLRLEVKFLTSHLSSLNELQAHSIPWDLNPFLDNQIRSNISGTLIFPHQFFIFPHYLEICVMKKTK